MLVVRLVDCSSIPKTDGPHRPNAFCLLRLSGSDRVHCSSVCPNSFTPHWHEEFYFPTTDISKEALFILLKSEESNDADVTLSALEIQSGEMRFGEPGEHWFEMTPIFPFKKGGRLRLAFALEPAQDAAAFFRARSTAEGPIITNDTASHFHMVHQQPVFRPPHVGATPEPSEPQAQPAIVRPARAAAQAQIRRYQFPGALGVVAGPAATAPSQLANPQVRFSPTNNPQHGQRR
jgi:hypothetical protein